MPPRMPPEEASEKRGRGPSRVSTMALRRQSMGLAALAALAALALALARVLTRSLPLALALRALALESRLRARAESGCSERVPPAAAVGGAAVAPPLRCPPELALIGSPPAARGPSTSILLCLLLRCLVTRCSESCKSTSKQFKLWEKRNQQPIGPELLLKGTRSFFFLLGAWRCAILPLARSLLLELYHGALLQWRTMCAVPMPSKALVRACRMSCTAPAPLPRDAATHLSLRF